MIAITSKKYDILEEALIVVSTSGVTCAIIQGNEVPEGWKRISLTLARTLCFKSSATWVVPDNSTRGRKEFDSLFDQWVEYISSPADTGDVTKNKSKFMIISDNGARKEKTLMDAFNDRKRKARWK